MPATSRAQVPAAERAYVLTKSLILSGQLPGGTLISEGEIAERTELSRTPVREAFLRLQAEDLLRLFPKRGAVVVPVAPGEAEDVLELREALEGAAVRRIARREEPLDDVVPVLAGLVDAQREPARTGDVVTFAEADTAFHRGIVAASGNALAERIYDTLADRQRRMVVQAVRPRPNLLDVLVEEHTALLDRIAARDADGFAETLRAHLDATHRTMTGR
ncbi:GntR family transcriptional regulator [Actinopolymorpha pittospori]|uniref:DNA-binding GntR family transcriptional regulator n=1 Tax=Actinopolymorpha pittospori TaxID=648752 RepID=A0A927MS93_9ACTN|nr:GntR family transcriptional regulator [Actinopolymorpha pittospori]MBE1605396.1 DNA-binding GntR family transcriptional regulator [Actinopolymorpha pittospori]